jgi:hypothetical protein
MDEAMHKKVRELDKEWGTAPILILSCAGAADEHWQIRHPKDMNGTFPVFPRFVVLQDGTVEPHPDARTD